jgi:ATP/maltotriose-dependent transcriptional regulator MalT
MTLLAQLQAHKGGLLQLKPPLYWYGTRSYDNNPGRVCLILDAGVASAAPNVAAAASGAREARAHDPATRVAAFLLIDGTPQWIWVVEADVELV